MFLSLNLFLEVLWVQIIPKWLIKVSGHIATLCWTLLELPRNQQKNDPQTPCLLQKHFKRIRTLMEICYRICFVKYGHIKFENVESMCT